MKYYVIAGERSGDLHAANLIHKLKEKDPNAEFRCWGGDHTEEEVDELVMHYEKLSFMGFTEVASNLGSILKALSFAKKDIAEYKPDALVLIDYGGFNMRVAKFARKHGFKVFYYISPKVWAWNTSRVEKIKKYVDHMFVILPFEKQFYKEHGYEVDYVGNPINDAVHRFTPDPQFMADNQLDPDKPIVAILPGSRKQEVEEMLHYMLTMLPAFMDCQLVVAAVHNLPRSYYELFRRKGIVKIVYNQTYDLLNVAHAAMVTSGTATLETALFEVPQVVCYKTSFISYNIARAVAKVKYISLVNLIADQEVVPELIQGDFTPFHVRSKLTEIVRDEHVRKQQKESYLHIKDMIGGPGASSTTADLIIKYLKEDSSQATYKG